MEVIASVLHDVDWGRLKGPTVDCHVAFVTDSADFGVCAAFDDEFAVVVVAVVAVVGFVVALVVVSVAVVGVDFDDGGDS
jgi:hypothetical protein